MSPLDSLHSWMRKYKPRAVVAFSDEREEPERIAVDGRRGSYRRAAELVAGMPGLGRVELRDEDGTLLHARDCGSPDAAAGGADGRGPAPAAPVPPPPPAPEDSPEARFLGLMIHAQASVLDRMTALLGPVLDASARLLDAAAVRTESAEVSVVDLLAQLQAARQQNGVPDPMEQALLHAVQQKLGLLPPPPAATTPGNGGRS